MFDKIRGLVEHIDKEIPDSRYLLFLTVVSGLIAGKYAKLSPEDSGGMDSLIADAMRFTDEIQARIES